LIGIGAGPVSEVLHIVMRGEEDAIAGAMSGIGESGQDLAHHEVFRV